MSLMGELHDQAFGFCHVEADFELLNVLKKFTFFRRRVKTGMVDIIAELGTVIAIDVLDQDLKR